MACQQHYGDKIKLLKMRFKTIAAKRVFLYRVVSIQFKVKLRGILLCQQMDNQQLVEIC